MLRKIGLLDSLQAVATRYFSASREFPARRVGAFLVS